MREISGYTVAQMAELVKVSEEEFERYETGSVDFRSRSFTDALRRSVSR
jgi:predicted transcriptional regulator